MTQAVNSGDAGTAGPPPAVPEEGRADYLTPPLFDLVRTPVPDEVLAEEAMVPMRDGIRLAVSIWRPRSGEPVPVIATATPYGKDRFDQWHAFGPGGSVPGGGFYMGHLEVSEQTPFEAPDPAFWVPRGYAVALMDLPGLGRSESNPGAPCSHQERWADIMAWLEAQEWCTGQVGMSGVSALCTTQWIAAMDPAPPQLKAIIAWEGINETGPGGGYGGIPETAFPAWIAQEWVGPNVNPEAAGPEPFLFDWQHDTSRIGVPALICASFSDQELHAWDTFDAFTRVHGPKWLFNHRRQKWGAFYGGPETELQERFLRRFLKGEEAAMDGVPPVTLEINESRYEYRTIEVAQWPPEATRYRELFLDATSGRLLTQQPDEPGSLIVAAEAAGDNANRAVFDLTFDRDTDLVGHMALRVFVDSEDTEDLDLFIGVEKLDRDGNEVYFFGASGGNANAPVTRGWLRASQRELDPERSTEWRPVRRRDTASPLRPGDVVVLDIALMPSGTTFRAGESLRLVIQSWSLPGQWEGGETRTWARIDQGRLRLRTGGEHASRLLVPELPA